MGRFVAHRPQHLQGFWGFLTTKAHDRCLSLLSLLPSPEFWLAECTAVGNCRDFTHKLYSCVIQLWFLSRQTALCLAAVSG